LKKDAIRR